VQMDDNSSILANLSRVAPRADHAQIQSIIDIAIGGNNDLHINKSNYYQAMGQHIFGMLPSTSINPTHTVAEAAGRMISDARFLPMGPLAPFYRNTGPKQLEELRS
jgi:alpha-tubulin suppressor-like RCC1 family protein